MTSSGKGIQYISVKLSTLSAQWMHWSSILLFEVALQGHCFYGITTNHSPGRHLPQPLTKPFKSYTWIIGSSIHIVSESAQLLLHSVPEWVTLIWRQWAGGKVTSTLNMCSSYRRTWQCCQTPLHLVQWRPLRPSYHKQNCVNRTVCITTIWHIWIVELIIVVTYDGSMCVCVHIHSSYNVIHTILISYV